MVIEFSLCVCGMFLIMQVYVSDIKLVSLYSTINFVHFWIVNESNFLMVCVMPCISVLFS